MSLLDDDDPAVTVSFDVGSYEAVEGGAGVVVTVQLSAAPEREVEIPLTATVTGGATAQGETGADYTGIPSSVTFGANETEKTFTVTAVDDSLDDDDEGVTLSFDTPLPDGVTPGAQATATVSLLDNDDPGVTVAFDAANYEAVEGESGVVVTVQLSAAPEREVVIPLMSAAANGATAPSAPNPDYTGIPVSVTFAADETEKTFTVTAVEDSLDDDDEGVTLSFDTPLPDGVTPGAQATATVLLLDNDDPGVTVAFDAANYEAVEGESGVVVTVQLSAAPEREVVIPLTSAAANGATAPGAPNPDYTGIPVSVTFAADETEKTFTVTAVDDSLDDDDEGVTLSFDTPLPDGVTPGAQATGDGVAARQRRPWGDGCVRRCELRGGRGRIGGGRDGATERRAGARGGDTAHVGRRQRRDGTECAESRLHGHPGERDVRRRRDGEDVSRSPRSRTASTMTMRE